VSPLHPAGTGLWRSRARPRGSGQAGGVDPVEALTRLGGIASTRALLGLTTRHRLRCALANGAVHRAGRNDRWTW
jgi:hypothetical protein